MNPFPERPLPPPEPPTAAPAAVSAVIPSRETADTGGLFKFIGNMQTDDYILLGIIAVLFFEGCDDYIMLAALGYLFVMGIL